MGASSIFGGGSARPPDTGCDVCHGTHHVRVAGRWRRCDCIRRSLTSHYVHAMIRGADAAYNPVWDTLPPLGLRTFTARGHFTGFRHAVWRALLAYEPTGLGYDVVTLDRLTEIRMQREVDEDEVPIASGYRSTRELVNLQLLVLVISAHEHPNRLTRSLFGQLLDERAASNRPTWVFTHLLGFALAAVLDDGLVARWFRSTVTFTETSVRDSDVDPSPAAFHSAPRSSGPGVSPSGQSDYLAFGGRPRRD